MFRDETRSPFHLSRGVYNHLAVFGLTPYPPFTCGSSPPPGLHCIDFLKAKPLFYRILASRERWMSANSFFSWMWALDQAIAVCCLPAKGGRTVCRRWAVRVVCCPISVYYITLLDRNLPSSRWSTTRLSKANLPYAINVGALFGANVVT